MKSCSIGTVPELLAAVSDPGMRRIEVAVTLTEVPSLRLAPAQELCGTGHAEVALFFVAGADGLQVSTDNCVRDLGLYASEASRVLCNDDSVSTLGVLELTNLRVTGQVQLLARNQVRGAHIEVDRLDIVAADTRSSGERPHAYGVSVLQGAFTLWNQQPADVTVTCALRNITAGRATKPVRGGGILVCGAEEDGGKVHLGALTTGPVYIDGGIPPGTPDAISGGVFVAYGVAADLVHNQAAVTTFGPNDMALDNWGTVERWIVSQKVTTHGPSGIGFVNFGELGHLRVEAPIETFGQGARGFNVYTGTVAFGDFDRIVTHGDGAVGVQIARPIGSLTFRRGIETFGAVGPSLVKGVVQELSAIALSIKPEGKVEKLYVAGGLKTNGAGIPPLEQLGSITDLHIQDGFASKHLL